MSNRLFQGLVHKMEETLGRTVGVIDENSVIISCSDLSQISKHIELNFSVIGNGCVYSGNTYRMMHNETGAEFAVFVEGEDKEAKKYCEIVSLSLSSIKTFYDEKYDKANFIKNVILDNILPGDIYIKARELHLNSETGRVVLLLRITSQNEVSVFEVIQNLFPDKSKDFVININDQDIAIVKEIGDGIQIKDLENLANSIVDTLSGEFYTHAVVGIGTPVNSIRELARSLKDAQVALEVGKVFDTEKAIVSYSHLGIARLVYQLPTTLCESFLHEILKKGSIDTLDHEILFTIQKFFENNLNVSETARKLFIHRNTLVYRLEKIKKMTGLDLREFDDAIVFKIAIMVKKYLTNNPAKF